MDNAYLIVNFGGPRNLEEIAPFLRELLTDRDVIRTRWPPFLHNLLFSSLAKKRAGRIRHDYQLIGGKSPIYEDTEMLAAHLRDKLARKVVAFHRYLPETHERFIEEIEGLVEEKIAVFPCFPQFTYATTGSIARWMHNHLSYKARKKMRWIRSYAEHPSFIRATVAMIHEVIEHEGLALTDLFFLFSAHGLPRDFVETGDPYESECSLSYKGVMSHFPGVPSLLSYQSKFGRGEWLRPYTDETCDAIAQHAQGKRTVLVVPISFTSEHIETLFEIEHLYLPAIRKAGFCAYRAPTFGLHPLWLEAIQEIITSPQVAGEELISRWSWWR